MSRPTPRLIALLVCPLLGVLLAVCLTGHMSTPAEVLDVFLGGGGPMRRHAILELRLPRALIGALVGGGLAISGMLLQGVTRNPLAAPGLLGISGGAGLAVLVLMTTYTGARAAPLWLLPVVAFAGGLASAAAILALSGGREGTGAHPARLLLVGIGLGAATGAISQVLALGVRPDLFRAVVAWQAGTLSGRGWESVAVLAPGLALGGGLALALAQRLDVMALGDPLATGLGVDCGRTRIAATVLAALLAGLAVAMAGAIGFVGLFAPHIARGLVGPSHRLGLPAAAAIGATVTCLADVAAHRLVPNTVLPTGAVVAVIGVPWLLFALARLYRR